MALTDNCDLYVAVHENGVNRVISHIMQQRPSVFNYGTADVAANPELWCEEVPHTADVSKYGNPLFSIEQPIPILGAESPPAALGFCAQVSRVRIDFCPGNGVALPAELSPPLKPQHFALELFACGAIECPNGDEINSIPVSPQQPGADDQRRKKQPPVVLRGKLDCFCLDVFVIGHFEHAAIAGVDSLLAKVDDIDIVDIKPDALEANIVCYLRTAIAVILHEKLTIPLSTFAFKFPLFGLTTVSLRPTPNSPVPNNPAVEDDQLKVFMTMTLI